MNDAVDDEFVNCFHHRRDRTELLFDRCVDCLVHVSLMMDVAIRPIVPLHQLTVPVERVREVGNGIQHVLDVRCVG